MPATQSRSDSSLAADFFQQFDQAQEQAKSVFAIQKELLDTLEEINEHWLARAKSEVEFATAMANKLAAIRSMPDMTTVYQDWFGQRMQRCVEDSNHVLADVQKLIGTGSRFSSKGQRPRLSVISQPTDLDCVRRAKSATGGATARALLVRKCRNDPSDRATCPPVQSEEMQAAPAATARASYWRRRRDGHAPHDANLPQLG
jgi:hypothetical protein